MAASFDEIKREAKKQWEALINGEKPQILVGMATCGRAAGALEVIKAIETETDRRGIDCNIVEVGCLGMCYAEPIVCINKPGRPGICYGHITAEKAVEIVERYLAGDDAAAEYSLGVYGDGEVQQIPRL